MSTGIVAAAAGSAPSPMRFDGVALAQVVDNRDMTGQARVQLRLPWLPGIEPWARVAVPMAGDSRGTFIIPQVGDEVLVAFNHGDARISLSASGAITVEGRSSIELKAPTVTVSASAAAEVSGDASVKVTSSGECSVSGSIVRIN